MAPCKASQIDTIKLINAIKAHPGLYDRNIDMYYTNKRQKMRMWNEACKEIFSNWDELGPNVKDEYCQEVQKRWKNLRTCVGKEFRKQKVYSILGQSNIFLKKRKKYEFYDQLKFLDGCIGFKPISEADLRAIKETNDIFHDEKKIDSDVESVEEISRNVEDFDIVIEEEDGPKNESSDGFQQVKSQDESPEEMIMSILRNTMMQEKDEDRQFFLSLVPSFGRLDDRQKMEAKIQMLQILKNFSFQNS